MSTPTLAEVRMFAGTFAPRGWHFCDGTLLSIAENDALFALIGTTYGGDGITTFALPDLRGRSAVGTGNGPGLPSILEGERAGVGSATMTVQNMPAHNHLMMASSLPGNSPNPEGFFFATLNDSIGSLTNNGYLNTSDTSMNAHAISTTGSGLPFSIIQPYLGMNFIIALEGIFPSRN